MKVLATGGRNWEHDDVIFHALSRLPQRTTIMHGGAKGADTIVDGAAKRLNYGVEVYPANWKEYGRAAGPIRNREMLQKKPDLVLAFHYDLASSKGTRDCVEEAQRRGIPVILISFSPSNSA